jgi:hypothetical protein
MNRNFIELNPIVVEQGFETNKIIALIMNKLLCGQFPDRFAHRKNKLEIYFVENPAHSSFQSYGNATEIKVPFNKDDTHFCNLFINTKDNLFKVQYDIEIFTDCVGNEWGLLEHIKQEGRYEIVARSFLRYQENDEENDDPDMKYVFKTGNHFYAYLKFFEENINTKVARMCQIQSYNNNGNNVQLSIADFFKMCKKGLLEDVKPPSTSAIKSLIDDLIYMSNSKIERIQAGILRITKSFGEWGTYRIYFGGTIVFNEYSVNRFKYIFHPGLQLVAKYLESDQKVETLRHKIEKEMFKRM